MSRLQNSNRRITLVGIMLLITLLSGASGGYFFGRSQQETPTETQAKVKTQAVTNDNNPYNGSDLSMVEMYDNLKSSTGEEFDRRLTAYLLAINLNQTGMLRQAESKSDKSELKNLASIQIGQNDKVLELLNRWQKEWGYTDH